MKGRISGQKYFSITVLAFLLLTVLALNLVLDITSLFAADYESAIKQAIPLQSELPSGIQWASPTSSWATTKDGRQFSATWQGKDPLTSHLVSYTLFCTITITTSSLSENNFRKMILNAGEGRASYSQLPGGVTNADNPGYQETYCDIWFWRNSRINGKVAFSGSSLDTMKAAMYINESTIRSETGRLAKLVWSRLPESDAGIGVVTDAPTSTSTKTLDTPDTGKLPDSTLPLATGVTTTVTTLLILMSLRAQGYSPAEAIQILRDWLRGKRGLPIEAQPAPAAQVPQYRDGEMDENGDIWSENDGSWVDPKQYDYWRNAQKEVDRAHEINEELRTQQSAYVKEVYDPMVDAKRKAEAGQQHIKDMEAKWAKEDGLTAQLRRLQKQMDEDSSWRGYLAEVNKNFGQNMGEDLYVVADGIRQTGEAFADGVDSAGKALANAPEAIVKGVAETYDALSNPSTYKEIAIEGAQAVQGAFVAGVNVASHPLDSMRKVNDFVMNPIKGAVTFTAKVGGQMIMHPVDTAKSILGVDNWEKILDYNVPITERLGRALYGAVDTTLNIATFGGSKIGLKAAETALGATKVVDTATDAAKGAGVASKVFTAADVAKDTAKTTGIVSDASKVKPPPKQFLGKTHVITDEEKALRVKNWDGAREAGQKDCQDFLKKHEQFTDKNKQWMETEKKYRQQYDDALQASQSKRLNESQRAAARDIAADAEKNLKKAESELKTAQNELKEATIKVNSNEQAKYEAKQILGTEQKQAFNSELQKVYKETDKAVVEELARKKGLDPKDLVEDPGRPGLFRDKDGRPVFEVAKPTNPSKEVKISMDQDVTYRERAGVGSVVPDPENPNKFVVKTGEVIKRDLRTPTPAVHKDVIRVPDPNKPGAFIDKEVDPIMVDVRADSKIKIEGGGTTSLGDIHAQKFYESATGKKPPDMSTARKFAEEHGQVVTDRLHKEAYGRGQADLKAAISGPEGKFSDSQQVGKAVGYKAHEFYERADKIRTSAPKEAESLMAEGMRQTTKQWDNQVLPRMNTIKAQTEKFSNELKGISPQFEIQSKMPTRLQKAVDIMRLTEKRSIPPVKVESMVLRETGLTINDVSTQVGEFVEAMQKLRPSWL